MQQKQMRARLFEQFTRDADAQLLIIAQMLVVVERTPDDKPKLEALCQAAHTLADNARLMNFSNIGSLSQALEDALVAVRDHGLKLTPALMDALFVALDGVEALLGMLKESGTETEADTLLTPEMLAALKMLNTAYTPLSPPPLPPKTSDSTGLTNRAATALGLGLRQRPNRSDSARQAVEIIYILSGHQMFGILMSQVYNILRPRTTGISFQVVEEATDTTPLSGGVISYLNRPIPVIELAQRLRLPQVTPVARSRILVTGTPQQPFGVAVDTIASTQIVQLADIQPMPAWITASNLGRFIWGAAAIDLDMVFATPETDTTLALSENRWDQRMHDIGIAPQASSENNDSAITLQTETGPYYLAKGPFAGISFDTSVRATAVPANTTRTIRSMGTLRVRKAAPSVNKRLILLLDLDVLAKQFLG